jgi:hypothetical protein
MGRKVKTSEPRQGTSMLMLLVLCSSSYVLQPRNLFGQRVEPVGVQAMRSPSRGIIVSAARNAGDIARDSVMSPPSRLPRVPDTRECWGQIVSYAITGGALGALAGSILGAKVAITRFVFGGAFGAF